MKQLVEEKDLSDSSARKFLKNKWFVYFLYFAIFVASTSNSRFLFFLLGYGNVLKKGRGQYFTHFDLHIHWL